MTAWTPDRQQEIFLFLVFTWLLVAALTQVSQGVDELQLQATDTLSLPPNVSLDALIHLKPVEYCDLSDDQPLKVYVYKLHQKFHVALLKNVSEAQLHTLPVKATGSVTFPYGRLDDGTVKGLSFEHSGEAYITFDLLFPPKVNRSTTQGNEVVQVEKPEEADVFFVPFLASLSFNRFSRQGMHTALMENDKKLQEELADMLTSMEWWQRSGGHDHILGMVQPNALRFVRTRIHNALFLVADFGRCPQSVSSLSKDVVVPYNHMLPTYHAEGPGDGERSWEQRKTLLYFQGTVQRKNEGYIRKVLYEMLGNESDVHFANNKPDVEGMRSAAQGMRSSKFCFHLAGDTPSSCRLFDAIVSHCVPVIVSNKLELPYESAIDYSAFAIFLSHDKALREGHLLQLLRNMPKDEWLKRWHKLLQAQGMFEFHMPSIQGDAASMMWREVRNKLPQIRRHVNEYQRKLAMRFI